MYKEWIGVMMGLGLAGAFAACESGSDVDDDGTTAPSATSSSTTTSAGGTTASQGGGGNGGQGGDQGGAGGSGGQGGRPDCSAAPQPVGEITDLCGGSSSASGGSQCEFFCDDEGSNTFAVACDLNTGTCECKVNDQVYCTCAGADGCIDHCCPAPWDAWATGGTGGSTNVTTVTTTGQTGSGP